MLSKITCISFLLFLTRNVSSEIYFEGGEPHARLSSGAVLSGSIQLSRDKQPFSSFQGIPYATIPKRFAESQLIQKPTWDGVKSAKERGPICPQIIMGLGTKVEGKEDCLVLNIYVPKGKSQSEVNELPVMVWIHGGAFVYGSGLDGVPNYFMDEDIILVTINYRLGVLGFLSTGDDVIPGNMGLKDQVNALRWVQNNIRSFGGNPDEVTIFGESAGGASVHHLVLSPMAKGLFHRAIAQSGSAFTTWAYESNPRDKAVKLATFLKCPTTASDPSKISSSEILTCFKETRMDELTKASLSFRTNFPMNIIPLSFSPTSEPEASPNSKHTPFMTQSPWSMIFDRNVKSFSDVPLIIGATEDEGAHMFASFVVRKPELLKDINSNWNEVAPNTFLLDKHLSCPKELKIVSDKLKEFYFGVKEVSKETEKNLSDLYSDAFFNHGVQRAAIETVKRSTSPVYLYQYAYPSPMPLMATFLGITDFNPKTVAHGDDLPLQFDVSKNFPGAENLIKPNSKDEMFSKNFIRGWTTFAKSGVPNHSWGSNEEWNPVSIEEANGAKPLKWYRLDSDPNYINDPYKDRVDFWDRILEDYFVPAGTQSKKQKCANDKIEL